MKESREDADWARRDSMSKADPRKYWATQKGPEERLPATGSLRGQTCPGPTAWEGPGLSSKAGVDPVVVKSWRLPARCILKPQDMFFLDRRLKQHASTTAALNIILESVSILLPALS